MPPIALRLRAASPGLLSLPWLQPLGDWNPDTVPLRQIQVGPSRHLVRFVEADGTLYALKELPIRVARKEYDVLRELEDRELPAVHAVGLVERGPQDQSILVTEYLKHSWQFRRLFQRMPPGLSKYRERLLDAMAILLVDLHRTGVFWGDCSLANTLFHRDGQTLQASLVDAETSEVHPALSDGQRNLDLGILVENVTGGLIDLAVRLGRTLDDVDEEVAAAESVAERYRQLWDELHHEETIGLDERFKVEARARRLNDLGFAVDELALDPVEGGGEALRLKVAVANRRFHATQLRALTGLEVGEGQARVLLNDLYAYRWELERSQPLGVSEATVGSRWRTEVLQPGMEKACVAIGSDVDPVQAYCDLLEVRWLLSEEAGRDVGDQVALKALSARTVPPESAAKMIVAEASTSSFPALRLPGEGIGPEDMDPEDMDHEDPDELLSS